jgi:hypothetical protein
VGLSVIIDGRLDVARARQVASFADRLGLAGVWLRRPWWPLGGPAMSEEDAGGLLAWLGGGAGGRAGLVARAGQADVAWLGRMAAVAAPGLRLALCGEPAEVGRWQRLIGRQPGLDATPLALPAGASLPPGPGVAPATEVFIPCSPGRDLAAEVAAAARAAAGRPVLAEVTVSVGRTGAEARARADGDGLFAVAGHPDQQGLFGTLEECQAAAARLAQAGVTELACYLPLASDLHDVLAQLRSIAVGASVLRPGDAPSAAPPPPAGWGGRRATG